MCEVSAHKCVVWRKEVRQQCTDTIHFNSLYGIKTGSGLDNCRLYCEKSGIFRPDLYSKYRLVVL